MEGAITYANAPKIQAKLIVEAANGPITFRADKILNDRKIVVLPDLYANAGRVVVSYFEWVKNLTHIPFGLMDKRLEQHNNRQISGALGELTGKHIELQNRTEIELVRSGLDEMMRAAYAQISTVWNAPSPEHLSLRNAAYQLAVQQIMRSYQALGL